jgi:hypothetical protein
MKILHDSFRAVAEIRQRAPKQRISLTVLLLVLAGVIGTALGCGSQQTPVSAMTSSSSGQNSTSPSELFTVPPEQMSHLHVVTVAPVRLDRMLRLTGAVAYNGKPNRSLAGRPRSFQSTLALRHQPGLLLAECRLYESAQCLRARR